MRADCKHYETRTYNTGDAVRKCNLDLAPEAPWRCPDACVSFTKRMADVNWQHGTLITPPTPQEPAGLGDGTVAALLDEAEDIVNASAPETIANLDRQQLERSKSAGSSTAGVPNWRRFLFGRKR
jgi:hypothetical protein